MYPCMYHSRDHLAGRFEEAPAGMAAGGGAGDGKGREGGFRGVRLIKYAGSEVRWRIGEPLAENL